MFLLNNKNLLVTCDSASSPARSIKLGAIPPYPLHVVVYQAIRIADKQSTSLFCYNGSIFLVAMKEKRIRISKPLKRLAWNKNKPKKITAAKFYEKDDHTNDAHLVSEECGQLHIHCGDLLLCIASNCAAASSAPTARVLV